MRSPRLERKFNESADRFAVKAKLKGMKKNIHPDFYASYKVFKKDLLSVLDERPSAANDNIALQELDILDEKLKKSNGDHDMDTFNSVMDNLAA